MRGCYANPVSVGYMLVPGRYERPPRAALHARRDATRVNLQSVNRCSVVA